MYNPKRKSMARLGLHLSLQRRYQVDSYTPHPARMMRPRCAMGGCASLPDGSGKRGNTINLKDETNETT